MSHNHLTLVRSKRWSFWPVWGHGECRARNADQRAQRHWSSNPFGRTKVVRVRSIAAWCDDRAHDSGRYGSLDRRGRGRQLVKWRTQIFMRKFSLPILVIPPIKANMRKLYGYTNVLVVSAAAELSNQSTVWARPVYLLLKKRSSSSDVATEQFSQVIFSWWTAKAIDVHLRRAVYL